MEQQALRAYYSSAERFPTEALVQFLTHGGKLPLETRELAFQWEGGQRFSRFRSFASARELAEALARETPERIEVGAVYDRCEPSRSGRVLGRELVFDLDLPDYDSLRTCPCKGGPKSAYCDGCWALLARSARLLDRMLEQEFGFERRLWVFSGQKGLHCWVLDDAAFSLDEQQREALCDRLTRSPDRRPSLVQKSEPGEWIVPRIDRKVTTQLTHLIKLPFCVHASTKNVSVPVRLEELEQVPRVKASTASLDFFAERRAILVKAV